MARELNKKLVKTARNLIPINIIEKIKFDFAGQKRCKDFELFLLIFC